MPISSDYRLRKGDVVSVQGLVTYVDDTGEPTVAVGGTSVYPPLDQIELVRPLFHIGETVLQGADMENVVEVMGINNDEIWVRNIETGKSKVVNIETLERDESLVQTPEFLRQHDPRKWLRDHSPKDPPPRFEVGAVEVAEGETVRNPDGTYTTKIGEFKPVEGPDPLGAVLKALNAEPIAEGFCDGITNGPSFDKGGF